MLLGGCQGAVGATRPAPAALPPGDPVRGSYLVRHVLACTSCHGDDLGGGGVDEGWLGVVVAPNLTPGGVGAGYAPVDWARAVVEGVAPDGRALPHMPTWRWLALEDGDLGDVAAALAAVPAVVREPVPSTGGLGLSLRSGLRAWGRTPPDPAERSSALAPDAAHGRWLLDVAGCADCHGGDLRGGASVTGPPGPSLGPWLDGHANGATFARALQGGVGRDGRALAPIMPWAAFSGLTLTEVDALWLAVRPGPGRGLNPPADAEPIPTPVVDIVDAAGD